MTAPVFEVPAVGEPCAEHRWGEWKPSKVLRLAEFRDCSGCHAMEFRAIVAPPHIVSTRPL